MCGECPARPARPYYTASPALFPKESRVSPATGRDVRERLPESLPGKARGSWLPGLWLREGAPLPLPGASRLTRDTLPLRPERSSSLTAFSLESPLSSPDASRPREPRRRGAPGEPLSGAHRPAIT